MKLRIKDNSIRLRLMKSEVAELAKKGRFESHINFGADGKMTYAITEWVIDAIDVKFEPNKIEVRIPKNELEQWANSEIVSIQASKKIIDSPDLKILIEKDFACLTDREGEDESDAYPNPNLTC